MSMSLKIIAASFFGVAVGAALCLLAKRLIGLLEREWGLATGGADGDPWPRTGLAPLYDTVLVGGAGILAVASAAGFPSACGFYAFALCAQLLLLARIDLETGFLPDRATFLLIGSGLLLNTQTVFVPGISALLGMLVGYGVLWVINLLGMLCTGRESVGQGDMKLLAGIGAWLGSSAVVDAALIGFVLSAVIGGLYLHLRGRQLTETLPFGPWLAVGGVSALFLGCPIAHWFLR